MINRFNGIEKLFSTKRKLVRVLVDITSGARSGKEVGLGGGKSKVAPKVANTRRASVGAPIIEQLTYIYQIVSI